MRRLGVTAATLTPVMLAAILAGCGGDDEAAKSTSRPKPKPQSSPAKPNDPAAVLGEAAADMEEFIPGDLNAQFRKDGEDFRIRTIDCTTEEASFTATCAVRGSTGRRYGVKVNVKRSDGSYTYSCPKCP